MSKPYRFLFMTGTGSVGHVNMILGVADELTRRGNRVGWIAQTEARARQLNGCNVDIVVTNRQAEPWPADLGEDYTAHVDKLTRVLFQDAMVAPLRQAIRQYSPDVTIVDCASYVGIAAAALEAKEYATIDTMLLTAGSTHAGERSKRFFELIRPAREQFFRRHNVACHMCFIECASPTLNIIFSIPEFVEIGVDRAPSSVFVGPATWKGTRPDERMDFPWQHIEGGRPLAYMSLGTLYETRFPRLFEAVDRQIASANFQLVVSAGRLRDRLSKALSNGAIVVDYAPQRALLERCRLFVTHGGHNSVMEALLTDTPMLVLPIEGDQFINGHYVARAGVGVTCAADAATDAHLGRAISELQDPKFKTAAAAFGRKYRASNGTIQAVERLLTLASTGSRWASA